MKNRIMTLSTIDPPQVKHSIFEDVLGILFGAFIVSLGLVLLKAGAAVTGGTAGLSLLLSYVAPVPFGVLFFVVNTPFFLLAIRGKGWIFAIRSAVAIALVSAFSSLHPVFLELEDLNIVYAALAGNILCGVGILMLFRHRSSLGGFNIVALLVQERLGVRAGYVQMILDTLVIICSIGAVEPIGVLVSALGAVILNLILALNHRPGRYLGF